MGYLSVCLRLDFGSLRLHMEAIETHLLQINVSLFIQYNCIRITLNIGRILRKPKCVEIHNPILPVGVKQWGQLGACWILGWGFGMLKLPWGKETFVPLPWSKPQQLPWVHSDQHKQSPWCKSTLICEGGSCLGKGLGFSMNHYCPTCPPFWDPPKIRNEPSTPPLAWSGACTCGAPCYLLAEDRIRPKRYDSD